MTQSVAQLLEAAEQLSASERAELSDRLVEKLAYNVPPEIEAAQIAEVHRRIERVQAGETQLIPGEQVFAEGRALLSSLTRERAQH